MHFDRISSRFLLLRICNKAIYFIVGALHLFQYIKLKRQDFNKLLKLSKAPLRELVDAIGQFFVKMSHHHMLLGNQTVSTYDQTQCICLDPSMPLYRTNRQSYYSTVTKRSYRREHIHTHTIDMLHYTPMFPNRVIFKHNSRYNTQQFSIFRLQGLSKILEMTKYLGSHGIRMILVMKQNHI